MREDGNVPETITFEGQTLDIPAIAAGRAVPHSVTLASIGEAEKKQAKKTESRRFWLQIAIDVLCVLLGFILGKFC